MLCFEKNLIHGVCLGLRPEEAGPRAQRISGSWARAGQPVGDCSASSEGSVGTPEGLVFKLSPGKEVERKSWDLSLPSP